MIYAADITTSASTTAGSPLRTALPVTKGLVYKLEVNFPRGSAGLMGVRFMRGGFQVWPSNRGVWFRGDDNVISFDDTYLIEDAPLMFVVETYNTDDTYEHEVLIKIGLVSTNIFMARFLPSYAYEDYLKILEDLRREQTEEQRRIIESPFPWIL